MKGLSKSNAMVTAMLGIALVAVLVFAVFPNTTDHVTAHVPDKVRIAYLPVVQALPFYLAEKKGYFTEAGIDVEAIKIDNPSMIIDSLVAGQADFAAPGAASGITAIVNYKSPGKLEIFALIGGDYSTTNDLLLVGKNSSILSIADLRGKNIGILPGIQFRTIARHIFAQNNITLDNVTLVEIAPALQAQALAAGQVDALITIEPTGTIVRAKNIGKDLIHAPMVQYISDPWYGAVGVVRSNYAKTDPEVTNRVLAVFDRAIDEINQNPEAAKQYLLNYTALTPDLVAKVPLPIFKMYTDFKQSDIDALQKFVDIFTLYGVIDGRANASAMIYAK